MTETNVTDPTQTAQAVGQTIVATAEELAPVALAAAAASTPGNAEVALAVKLAPIALQTLQSALQLSQAGALSPAQLAALFSQIGAGIQQTHNQWEALNQATSHA